MMIWGPFYCILIFGCHPRNYWQLWENVWLFMGGTEPFLLQSPPFFRKGGCGGGRRKERKKKKIKETNDLMNEFSFLTLIENFERTFWTLIDRSFFVHIYIYIYEIINETFSLFLFLTIFLPLTSYLFLSLPFSCDTNLITQTIIIDFYTIQIML